MMATAHGHGDLITNCLTNCGKCVLWKMAVDAGWRPLTDRGRLVRLQEGLRMDDPGEVGGLVDCPFEGLPPPKGGRVAKRVNWQVVRTLRLPDDLPLLFEKTPTQRRSLKQVRHSHHQLARLLATGVDQAEASLITGYSPTYISVIKDDPTFCGLIEYYHDQRDQIFVDVVERMRTLGLSTLDELQHRLEEEPDEWSRRELMEMAELMLVKPAAARTPLQVTASAAPVAVNIRFVTAQHNEPKQIEGTVIDQPLNLDPASRT